MPTAIELSVLLGLPLGKVIEFCKLTGVELEEAEFATDKEFETVARSVKRKRASSYAMAFLAEYATKEQREFILALDPAFALEYSALDLPIVEAEYLQGAGAILDALAKGEPSESRQEAFALADWVRRTVRAAGKPIGHAYLAVRLLLSLPASEARAYPQTIASVFNRLRHRGFLDGWFSVQEIDGKNSVIYADPSTAPSLPWLTADKVQAAAKLLGTREVVNIAGYLAAMENANFEEIKSALIMRPELIFSAIPLDL